MKIYPIYPCHHDTPCEDINAECNHSLILVYAFHFVFVRFFLVICIYFHFLFLFIKTLDNAGYAKISQGKLSHVFTSIKVLKTAYKIL